MKLLRIFLLFIIFSGVYIHGFPAEDKPELKNAIKLIDSLCKLSTQYRAGNWQLSMSYGMQALSLSKTFNFQEGEAMAYYLVGLSYFNQQIFPSALECYFKSIDGFQKLNDIEKEILVNESIIELFIRLKDPEKAETYLKNEASLIKESQNPESTGRYFRGKGLVSFYKRKYNESEDFYYQSIEYGLPLKQSEGVGLAYKMLGDLFMEKHLPYNAIFLYQKALHWFMELKNPLEVSVLNTRIAHVYQVLGQKQLTLDYNIKSYNERKQAGNRNLIVSSIINIGGAYMELGRFDSAEYYLNLGLKKSQDENHTNLFEEVYQLLADCYSLQGNYKLSLEYFQKYFNYHLKILADRNNGLIHTLESDHLIKNIENTHELLIKQNEAHDAELRNHRLQLILIGIFLFLALSVGLIVNSLTHRTKKVEKDLQLLNIKLETEIREHIEAVRGLQMSESIYRFLAQNSADVISLFDKNIRRKFISPSCKNFYGYTEEELLTRPDSLEVVDLSYRKQVRNSLESMLTGKTAKTLVYKARKKDGTAFWVEGHINPMFDPVSGEVNELVSVVRDISDRVAYEEQLAMNERQKELLLYEIHHRVKNNFAILISLMELQRQYATGKTLDVPITDLQLRVRTMSLVHEQLYHNQSIDSIPLGAYLERLTAIISSAFSKPNVEIHSSLMECAARIEIALPLGLIVNELLTNAFKYAFPDNMDGNIWIDLRLDPEKSKADKGLDSIFYILTLRDDGIGLQEDFSFDANESTGSQIIKILIEQLEAEYEVKHGPGFCFILKFAAFPKEYN